MTVSFQELCSKDKSASRNFCKVVHINYTKSGQTCNDKCWTRQNMYVN